MKIYILTMGYVLIQTKSENSGESIEPKENSTSAPSSPVVDRATTLRKSKTALGQIKRTPPPSPFLAEIGGTNQLVPSWR